MSVPKAQLEALATGAVPLDPYLVWALLTRFRDYQLDEGSRVALAVECKTNVAAFDAAAKDLGVEVCGFYTDKVVDPLRATYCTARVALGLDKDPTNVLEVLRLVKRMELGTAVRAGVNADTFMRVSWNPTVVVGVIDDFVAFGNPCFESDHGTSRVAYVWGQSSRLPNSRSKQWGKSQIGGYGYELTSLSATQPPTLTTLRKAYPTVLPRHTHGTHVADIAAGNSRRADSTRLCEHEIVAVHLPRRVLADSSGGALSVQALDGLRYIVHRAGPAAAVVVNLSYGTTAGPHDGRSILEAAIDELIDLREGLLAVVVPAGNAYEDRCHASVPLGPRDRTRTLTWNVLPDDRTPSFMEIWLPEGASSQFQVEVRGPSGAEVLAGTAPAFEFDKADIAEATVGVIHLSKVANGSTGTMILVALASTRACVPGAPVAAHGLWTVKLSYLGPQELPGPVRVWIERDDTVHGQPRAGRQSYLVDPAYPMPKRRPGPPADHPASLVQRHGSFNTIATGEHTIVVGGYVGVSGEHAPYSGAGPTRSNRLGPDILAMSEESRTLHGRRAAAVAPGDSVRLNGTSVAVPQIVRYIADWQARPGPCGPRRMSPEEIRCKLEALAKENQEVQPLPKADEFRDGRGRVPPPS